MGYREMLSVPAENQGVVKGEAGEAGEGSKGIKNDQMQRRISPNIQNKRTPTLLYLAAIIIRIFGEEPACVENRRGNYCIIPKLPSIGRSPTFPSFQSQRLE